MISYEIFHLDYYLDASLCASLSMHEKLQKESSLG
jgi:hypothetical protein